MVWWEQPRHPGSSGEKEICTPDPPSSTIFGCEESYLAPCLQQPAVQASSHPTHKLWRSILQRKLRFAQTLVMTEYPTNHQSGIRTSLPRSEAPAQWRWAGAPHRQGICPELLVTTFSEWCSLAPTIWSKSQQSFTSHNNRWKRNGMTYQVLKR